MITLSFCGILLLVVLIILLKSRSGFKEIDEMYGKPYMAKLVIMIGGHPELTRGSMAMSLHPMDAIAFNRKVFLFSQIDSIKITSNLPERYNEDIKNAVNPEVEQQYLCVVITDEYGKHEIIFTPKSDFKEVANQLIQKWNKYNLLV
ncbi:hypothetical protein DSBG_3516 [Desulfosporosinus sp. BG]|nr:hypothetical protein DSBG_3516 [Desulfosporosinus sp. BG]